MATLSKDALQLKILIGDFLQKDPGNRCIPAFQDLLWEQIEAPPS